MIYERKGSLTGAYGSEEALSQHQQANLKKPALVLKSNVGRPNLDGHRLLFAACACLAGASLFGLLSVVVWTHHWQGKVQVTLDIDPSSTRNHDKWSSLAVVRGHPTDSFRGMRSKALIRIVCLYEDYQTTCEMILNTLHHGLLQDGVCLDFSDQSRACS